MSAARELRPSPSPSAIPVATAITFLSAPPSSTPMTSSFVYTRKLGELSARCTRVAASGRSEAATTAVGWPCATSRAKSGPDSATTGTPGSSSRRTSVITLRLPRSIPFVATTATASGPTAACPSRTTSRSTCDGATYTTTADPATASACRVVATTAGWRIAPGRKRGLSCVRLTWSTTSGSRGPEHHLVPATREEVREGAAPRAAADDRAPHQPDAPGRPRRDSSPRRRRPMLLRCVQNTKRAQPDAHQHQRRRGRAIADRHRERQHRRRRERSQRDMKRVTATTSTNAPAPRRTAAGRARGRRRPPSRRPSLPRRNQPQ